MFSKKLSFRIAEKRETSSLATTTDLNRVLDDLVVGERNKYFAQVYQSLRIEVNQEMESLSEMLEGVKRILKIGGRFVGISYHSLEDRMVKRFLKSGFVDGKIPKDDFGRSLAEMKMLGKIILPSEEEQLNNSRSKSAKMRVGERIKN